MTTNAATADTYRRTVVALSLLAGLAMAGFLVAGHPLVGAGAFAALMLSTFVVRSRSETPIYDERTREHHERAAGRTMALFGWGSAAFFPAMTVLVATDHATWPAWLTGVAFFIPVLYGAYGLFVAVETFA